MPAQLALSCDDLPATCEVQQRHHSIFALVLFSELMYTLLNKQSYFLNIATGELFPHRSKEDEYVKAAD
jgi:hypothetical protein